MTSLPAEVTYGTVVGKFVKAIADGIDGDTNPDSQAIAGTVTFTPITALKVASSTPPVTVLPQPITVTLDASGALSVKLVATDDPATNPHDWTYLVTFQFQGLKYASFSFSLPAGTTQDLTVLAPVATQGGTPLVRGVGITSASTDGSGNLVLGMSDGTTLTTSGFVANVAAAMAGNYVALAEVGSASGVAALGSDGIVPTAQLPPTASPVSYAAQTLTTPQQAQAQANIGLAAAVLATGAPKNDLSAFGTYLPEAHGAAADGTTDDHTALAATITAAGVGGRVYIQPGKTYAHSTTLSPLTNQRVYGGGTLKKIGNVGQITVSGVSGVLLDRITLDGNQAGGFTGDGVDVLNTSSNIRIERCTFTNHAAAGVLITGTLTNVTVERCTFSGGISTAAVTIRSSSVTSNGIFVRNNYIDMTASVAGTVDGISVTCNSASGVLRNVKIEGNTVLNGKKYGIEVANASAGTLTEVDTVGNTIIGTTASASGGISYSGTVGGTVRGNTIDDRGFSCNFAIELAGATDAVVIGNSIVGSATTTAISHSTSASRNIITDNRINGFVTNAIKLSVSSAVSQKNTIVAGNLITFTGALTAIWVQSNNASAVSQGHVITGNEIIGDGTSGSIAVKLSNDAVGGVCSFHIVKENRITSVTTAVLNNGSDSNTISLMVPNSVTTLTNTTATFGVGNVIDAIGTGAPAHYAGIGSTYRRQDGGSATSFYVKESGDTATTGWVGK